MKLHYTRLRQQQGYPRWFVDGLGRFRRMRDAKRHKGYKAMRERAEDGPRFRLRSFVGDVFISTVGDFFVPVLNKRIPLGYGTFEDGLPEMWYETMAFIDGKDDSMRRYLTEQEARIGHAEVVAFYTAVASLRG